MKYRKLSFAVFGIMLILATAFKYKESTTKDFLVTIKTDFGVMKVLLFDDTPVHKRNFITLAAEGAYNGSTFHRVINGFMIQGGALSGDFAGKYDTLSFNEKTLPNEIMDKHKHDFGALAAARTANPGKRSDISQFYIVQNHNGAHHLDNNYTVFGKVVVGFDVIDKIAAQPVNGSTPVNPIKMQVSVDVVKRSDVVKFNGDVYPE
jgi:peptidyl-prolyl cis-trans isomerase B (cyclophilin B)